MGPCRRAGRRESLPTVRTLDFLRFWPGRQGRQGRQALFQIRVRIAILLRMWKSPFRRSEEHTSELQSLMRISYAVFCLKKKKQTKRKYETNNSRLRSNYRDIISHIMI